MRLPRAGREFYSLQVNSIQGILFAAIEASFDNGATWHAPTAVLSGEVRWLVSGPDHVDESETPPPSIPVLYDVLVLVRATDGDGQVVIRPASLLFLVDPASILSAHDVFTAMNLSVDDFDEDEIRVIEGAVAEVVSDLTAYLGQPIVPTVVALRVGPYDDTEHTLAQYPHARDVTFQVAANGALTMRFTYGIDARFSQDTAPIRSYLRRAVLNHSQVVTMWRAKVPAAAARVIRTVSTEGQSVGFDLLSPTGEAEKTNTYSRYNPEPDPRAALDRWRVARRRVYQAPGYGSDPLGDDILNRDTFVPW